MVGGGGGGGHYTNFGAPSRFVMQPEFQIMLLFQVCGLESWNHKILNAVNIDVQK